MDSAVVLPFKDYEKTVFKLMDRLEVAPLLAEQGLILLKPNLVTSSPPPVTTDVGMVAAVAKWCREVTSATIVVVEGSGEGETHQNYRHLGYRKKVPADDFIDLDREEIAEYAHPEAERFARIWLPKLVTEGFLISIRPAITAGTGPSRSPRSTTATWIRPSQTLPGTVRRTLPWSTGASG